MTNDTQHVEVNSRKQALELATKWFETWLGAAEAGDVNVMVEMRNRIERIHRAIKREITDSARLVDAEGNPAKHRSLGRFDMDGQMPSIKKH